MLQATIAGRDFSKEDVSKLLNESERAFQMQKVFAMPNALDFNAKPGKAAKPKAAGKSKAGAKEKAPKADTKDLSLQLHKAGKSIAEIAKERKLVVGTVEAHLAHYIATQEISPKDVIDNRKLKKILSAIKELKTLQLNPIREHLGRDFTFGEIKIGLAAHIAEGD